MNEDQVMNLLKSRLKIEIDKASEAWVGSGIRVNLLLDDDIISSDIVITKHWEDY